VASTTTSTSGSATAASASSVTVVAPISASFQPIRARAARARGMDRSAMAWTSSPGVRGA
jgi:hypothetical protein